MKKAAIKLVELRLHFLLEYFVGAELETADYLSRSFGHLALIRV